MNPDAASASAEGSLAFRLAMRRLAATVTIISAGARSGTRFGMTATAVSSVTADPPTLLICVNRRASIHGPIAETGRFAVNLLGTQHAGLVPVFGGRVEGEGRFAHGAWATDDTGTPYLLDAQASLCCEVREAVPYGTHTIFIGEVSTVRLAGEIAPLLYQNGALATAASFDPDD